MRALFSGDTVIDPAYWGEQALVRAFCRLIGRLARGLAATVRSTGS